MLKDNIENILIKNLDTFYVTLSKKYKIPKTKLKTMWSDRQQSYIFQEFTPRSKGIPVLEMLHQLKVTEKIVRIKDHYIHPPTGFIFDPVSRKVIGIKIDKTDINSEIKELTENDIEDCKQWKFDHIIPINLDKNTITLEKEIEQMCLGDNSDCSSE
jgi:hypothetical protein